MIITGEIIRHIPSERMLVVLSHDLLYKCRYNNLAEKQFGRYFLEKVHVELSLSDDYKEVQDSKIYRVLEFIKISYLNNRHELVYYDLKEIKNGIKDVLFQDVKRMYLDLELSMHPYYKTNDFTQEIIEIGLVVEDELGNILEKQHHFVQTVKCKTLTKRTLKFLNITQEDVDNGLSPKKLNELLLSLQAKYQAKIIVWGRNDFLALDEFYAMHKLIPATSRKDFINLLQLYKTYHSLKNDPGLFNCLSSYGKVLEEQSHNPLEDALVTREIYHLFRKEVKESLNESSN